MEAVIRKQTSFRLREDLLKGLTRGSEKMPIEPKQLR